MSQLLCPVIARSASFRFLAFRKSPNFTKTKRKRFIYIQLNWIWDFCTTINHTNEKITLPSEYLRLHHLRLLNWTRRKTDRLWVGREEDWTGYTWSNRTNWLILVMMERSGRWMDNYWWTGRWSWPAVVGLSGSVQTNGAPRWTRTGESFGFMPSNLVQAELKCRCTKMTDLHIFSTPWNPNNQHML